MTQRLTQSPVLCSDLCSCVGFHRRPACRVCGGLHLARSSGKCHLWGPIPAGHICSTALHRPPTGRDCTQGGCKFCLPWCHRKGKPDAGQKTTFWMSSNLLMWLNPSYLNDIYLKTNHIFLPFFRARTQQRVIWDLKFLMVCGNVIRNTVVKWFVPDPDPQDKPVFFLFFPSTNLLTRSLFIV